MTDRFYKDFPKPVLALIAQGEGKSRTKKWLDYTSLGVTHVHIPELLHIIAEIESFWGDEFVEGPDIYAPIHAWRALGQLKAEEAILPLANLILWDEEGDVDWIMEEIPEVMAMIGPACIPALREHLLKDIGLEWAPVTLSHSLAEVGQLHPESCGLCVQALEEGLKSYETNEDSVNAFLISYLSELKAVESVSLVEQAFQADKVDLSVAGDFEEFQIEVGLLEKRLTPRPRFSSFPFIPKVVWASDAKTRREEEQRKREKDKKEKEKKKEAKKARKRHKGKRK